MSEIKYQSNGSVERSQGDEADVTETEPLRTDQYGEVAIVNHIVQKRTFWSPLKTVWDNITVEPVMMCHVFPTMLSMLATQNLILDKACKVNLGYSDEVCTALRQRHTENYKFEETEVQKLTASVQSWRNVFTLIPLIIILFIGGWSDKTGKRKAVILVPIFGQLLTTVGLIINVYFMNELPLEVAVFTECLISALTGGSSCLFMGLYSYISDITNDANRTFRMGVLHVCMSIGFPIGSAISGVLLNKTGYFGVFFTAAFFHTVTFIYGLIFLKEPKRLSYEEVKKQDRVKSFLREFFNPVSVKKTIGIAFKHGPNNRRLKIVLVLLSACLIFGPMNGEMGVMYLFVRYKFNWNEVNFSMYATYTVLTHLVGTFVALTVFSKILKCDDSMLGIISVGTKIVAAFAYAFARTPFELYCAPLVEVFSGTSLTALRSLSSKLVSSGELGKLNSLFSLAEGTMPIIFGPMYSKVYNETLEIFPGAFFLLGAAFTLPALAIFMWLYIQSKAKSATNKITA